jgi:hypothetical protein
MQKFFQNLYLGFYSDNMVNENTDIPQNQSIIGYTKSVPCIGVPSILPVSDHSMMSDKTFNAAVVDNREIDKPTEKSSKVRTLIDYNNKLIQEKRLNAHANNYENKKKSFNMACQNLAKSFDSCVNMKGDMDQEDDVNNFVRTY